MKILIVGDGESPNSRRSYRVDPLAIACRNKGWAVTVVAYKPKNADYSKYEEIKFEYAGDYTKPSGAFSVLSRIKNYAKLQAKVNELLNKNNFDVIRSVSLFPTFFSLNKKIPVIADMGDNFAHLYKEFGLPFSSLTKYPLEYIQNKTLKETNLVIINSDIQRKYFSKMHPEKSVVLPNGLYLDKFVNSKKLPKYKEKVIFFHGDISRLDGLDVLVKAVSLLDINYKVILVGDGPKKYIAELKRMIADYNLTDKFIFTGWVPHSEVPSYIELADVCVAPMKKSVSTEPAIPAKIVEYLGMNKKIISTNCAGIKQFFSGKIDFFEDGDYKALAHLIHEALNSKTKINYSKFMENFDWQTIAKYEVNLIEKFLSDKEQDFRKLDFKPAL